MEYPTTLTDNLTRYDLKIPMVPPSWNEIMRKHWKTYSEVKTAWFTAVRVLAINARIPYGLRHVYLSAKVYYPEKRRRDADNCMVWKLTQDALRNAGIIDDDNPAIVTTLQPDLLVDQEDPRTEITIYAEV